MRSQFRNHEVIRRKRTSPRHLQRAPFLPPDWQFACLDDYRPPEGLHNRCVRAEPFPPVLAKLVRRIEELAKHSEWFAEALDDAR